MKIVCISCRVNAPIFKFINKHKLNDIFYCYVESSLYDEFVQNNPGINFVKRDLLIFGNITKELSNTPGGARLISFNDMKNRGEKAILSVDDDITAFKEVNPLMKNDGEKNMKPTPAGEAMLKLFEHAEEILRNNDNVAEIGLKYISFASQRPISSLIENKKGYWYSTSDCFIVNLEVFDVEFDGSTIQEFYLRNWEDQWYGLESIMKGKRIIFTTLFMFSKVHIETANIGRSENGISKFYSTVANDPKFSKLFPDGNMISNNNAFKFRSTRREQANGDDWGYLVPTKHLNRLLNRTERIEEVQ